MKEKNTEGQELLCINTEKVYDWITKETTFNLNITDLDLPINPISGMPLECSDIDIDTVTCAISPTTGLDLSPPPIEVLDRVDKNFVIDGKLVTLQLVTIRKNFEVSIFVDLVPDLGGATIEVDSVEFTRIEQVILCAPMGTDVKVSYTDLDCFVIAATCNPTTTATADELNVSVSVRLCQSIQSTFDVTLEVCADFCRPRDGLLFPPCPAPTIPPQCPIIFPNNDNKNNC
ncbi:hypothetical protein ACFPRA_15400 [Sporosarcina soli]|uniref:SipL SPOCS domain-containing protein n=1 Tax=Sporosarcina soli TaxID=334736 RepID=A0ABW0TLJ6_9BACL